MPAEVWLTSDEVVNVRAEALRLAVLQVGPWRKGRITKHMKTVLATAVLLQTYMTEGEGAAMEIANNNVTEDRVLRLVPKSTTVGEG